NQTALTLCDRALLRKGISVGIRQVFIFTKAKILYTQKRYAAAAALFHQLAVAKIRSAPGGTTKDEARYFEALSLSKAARTAAAKAIWEALSSEPFTYYGARAAAQLGAKRPPIADTDARCTQSDKVFSDALDDITSVRRPLRTTSESTGDAVSELMFLHL